MQLGKKRKLKVYRQIWKEEIKLSLFTDDMSMQKIQKNQQQQKFWN